MAYSRYLNKQIIVYRAAENVKDELGDPVQDPYTVVGTYRARYRNLSGRQSTYLERNTTEDFQRIYTTYNANVQPLDVVKFTELDGTVIKTFSVRRIITPERTTRRHHIELDVVGYDIDFTVEEAEYALAGFTSLWETTTANETITLPWTNPGQNVDWGDGNIDQASSHEYATAGQYTIIIGGSITGFRFNDTGDKTKIKTITDFSNFDFDNSGIFYGCSDLTITATETPTISGTNLDNTFRNTSVNIDVSNWPITSVTSMADMFTSSSLSDANYALLVEAWSQLSLQSNVSFGAGPAQYALESNIFIYRIKRDFNWTITDSGPEIEGNVLNLHAGFEDTITEISNDVSNWDDISVLYNNDHGQTSAGLRPGTGSRTLNSKNVIDLDNEFLEREDALGLSGNQALTVFLVIQSDVNVATTDTYYYLGEATGAGGQRIGFSAGSDGYSYRFADGNQVFNSPTLGSAQILVFKRASGSTYGDGQFFENGVGQIETSSGNPTNTLNLANEKSIVGSSLFAGSNTSFMDGFIAQIIVYNRELLTSEQSTVRDYLETEWGL